MTGGLTYRACWCATGASGSYAAPAWTITTGFAALQNAKEILEGRWTDRAYDVNKKGEARSYRINKSFKQWPTRFVRPSDATGWDGWGGGGDPWRNRDEAYTMGNQ